MAESGYHPPGAEFDPRAPYNEDMRERFVCTRCGENTAIPGMDICDICHTEELNEKQEIVDQFHDDRKNHD